MGRWGVQRGWGGCAATGLLPPLPRQICSSAILSPHGPHHLAGGTFSSASASRRPVHPQSRPCGGAAGRRVRRGASAGGMRHVASPAADPCMRPLPANLSSTGRSAKYSASSRPGEDRGKRKASAAACMGGAAWYRRRLHPCAPVAPNPCLGMQLPLPTYLHAASRPARSTPAPWPAEAPGCGTPAAAAGAAGRGWRPALLARPRHPLPRHPHLPPSLPPSTATCIHDSTSSSFRRSTCVRLWVCEVGWGGVV